MRTLTTGRLLYCLEIGNKYRLDLSMKNYISRRIELHIALGFVLLLFFGLQFTPAQEQKVGIPSLKSSLAKEHKIAGAEIHRYRFNLQKGRFFQVRVEQKSIDVMLRLRDAGDQILAAMDSPNGKEGPETLSFAAQGPASLVLEINSLDEKADAGIYIIAQMVTRVATEQDRRRVEIERSFMQGMSVMDTDGLTAATLTKMEAMLKDWQELPDVYMAEITAGHIRRFKNRTAKSLYTAAEKLAEKGDKESIMKAIGLLTGASLLTRETGEQTGEAASLSFLATLCYNIGDKKAAVDYYGQAAALAKVMGDQASEASLLNNLGTISYQLSENRQAIDYFNQALVLFRILKNRDAEAAKLNDIGAAYLALNEREKAIEYFGQSLVVHRENSNKDGEATSLTNMGKAFADLEKPEEALKLYLQAVPIYKTVDNKPAEANNYRGMGVAYAALGENEKALDVYSQALPFYRRSSEKLDLANILDKMALIHAKMGDKAGTVEFFQQSLTVYQDRGDEEEQVRTLSALSSILMDLGEKLRALEYSLQSLSVCRKAEEKQCEAVALNEVGAIYFVLGERQKALTEYYEEALPIFAEIQSKEGESWTHTLIGNAYSAIFNDREKALEHYQKALILAREGKSKKMEVNALNGLASSYDAPGERQKKLEYYLQVLAIDKVNNMAMNNIASVYEDLGDKEKARDYRMKVFLTMSSQGRDGEALSLIALQANYLAQGNTGLALFFGKQAVDKFQELRKIIQKSDYETQKSFLRNIDFVYKDLAELLIKEGRLSEAVQIINFYQDQQFYDFNHNSNEPIKHCFRLEVEAALMGPYERASAKIRDIGNQIAELRRVTEIRGASEREKGQLKRLEADLQLAADVFQEFLKQAEREFMKPDENRGKAPQIPSVTEMQATLRKLGITTKQNTVALYTLIGRTTFYVLLVEPDGGIKSFKTPIRDTDLNEKIRQFYAVLRKPFYDPRPLGNELYNIVFKPVEASLKAKGVQTLLWSLEGNFRYIPVAALWDGKNYLIESYRNVVFTRADSERMERNVSEAWSGIGFGTSRAQTVKLPGARKELFFPALPGMRYELDAIFGLSGRSTGLVKGETLTDEKFTQKSFFDIAGRNFQVVHVSSHFSFLPGDDSRSFLLLGDGSVVSLSELKKYPDLFQGVELLTLSACDTAAIQTGTNGREIDAFAELAQRLGSSAVIATLWKVRENSTARLMEAFYKNRKIGKLNKAQALQDAQLEVLRGGREIGTDGENVKSDSTYVPDLDDIKIEQKYRIPFTPPKKKPFAHPYYWSPFVLYGNWK